MKKFRSLKIAALACAALLATTTRVSADETDASLKATLEASTKAGHAGIASGNMSAFTENYSEDSWLLPPNASPAKGKAAIVAAWQAMSDAGALKGLSWWATRVERVGQMGVEYGEWVVKDEDGKVLDQGNLLAVWRHSNGSWKIIADTWNSTMPLPAAN